MFSLDVLWGTLIFTVVYAVLAAAGLAVDARLIDGDPVWLKPFKFTDFHRALYGVMALAAVALVMTGATTGLMVLLDGNVGMTAAMRWTVGLAFVLSTGLTIVTALTMGGRLTHHLGAWLPARLLAPEGATILAVALTLSWSAMTVWAFQVVLGGRPWPLQS
jgi:hypothetical protein